jgi:nitroreductase
MAETPNISTHDILNAFNWRYATKSFDPSKKLTDAQWQLLEQSLILSPSSFGLQPWRFLVITSQELKQTLVKASWNQKQVAECSHHVVFAAKKNITSEDIEKYIQAISATRKIQASDLEGFKKMMVLSTALLRLTFQMSSWTAKQSYIALGNLMTAAALQGIDTCPMEGIDKGAYDKILGLKGSGYTTAMACCVGFRSKEDKYANLPKVRYSAQELIIKK